MALLFDDASSQYLEASSAVLTGSILTMACWARPDDISGPRILMALNDASSEDNYHSLGLEGGFPIARTRGTGNADAIHATAPTLNTYQHYAGVWSGAASRAIFLDGINKVTDATSETPAGIDTTAIARLSTLTPGSFWSGRVAEAAIWNVALTDAEITQLALGVSPLLIRPDNLVAYWPIFTDGTDVVGTFNATAFNGPTIADHVTILEVEPLQIGTNPFVPLTITRSLTNTFAFGQSLVVGLEVSGIVSNSILFNQQLPQPPIEYLRLMENIIALNSFVETNIKQFSLESVFLLSPIVEPILDIARSLTTIFLLEQKAQKTIEESVSNTFSMADILAFGEDPSNKIKFDNSVLGDKSTSQKNNVGFGGSVSISLETNPPVENDVAFGGFVVAQLVLADDCRFFEYRASVGPPGAVLSMPNVILGDRSDIILAGIGSVTLRNPEFGNTTSVRPARIRDTTLGRKNRAFADPIWPKLIEQTLTVDALTRTKALEVLTFFKNNLGLEVTFTDQNNRIWIGVITGPNDPITEIHGDDCRYRAKITFISAVETS